MSRMKRPATIILALMLLLLAAAPVMAWDDCPKDKVVCDQPCRYYIDTNNNGTCDHVEAAPASGNYASSVGTTSNPTSTMPVISATTTNNTASNTTSAPSAATSGDSTAAADANSTKGANQVTTVTPASSGAVVVSDDGSNAAAASPADQTSLGQKLVTALKQPTLIVTFLMLVAATVAVRQRWSGKVRLGIMGISLASLGFYFQGCICPVGVLANLPLHLVGLLQGKYMLWLLLLLLPIIFLFWAGRVFCSSVCPIGMVQEFTFRLGRRLGLNRGRPGLEKLGWLRYSKYVILVLVLVVTPIVGSAWWCDIDPFGYLFNLSGSRIALGLLMGVLIVSLFISRFWCRFLCPYGALLGILNKDIALLKQGIGLGVNGPVIDPVRCKNCGKCARACPVNAIVSCVIDETECINCGECSRQCKLGAIQSESPCRDLAQPSLSNVNYERMLRSNE